VSVRVALAVFAGGLGGGQNALGTSVISVYTREDFYMVPALAVYLLLAIVMIVIITNKNSGAMRGE
jgi:hypothetical protein